jgi:hypothetical protein
VDTIWHLELTEDGRVETLFAWRNPDKLTRAG